MIDSVNFKVNLRDGYNLDLDRLKGLGIKCTKIRLGGDKNGKSSFKFEYAIHEIYNIVSDGYIFNYAGVGFTYYTDLNMVIIRANAHKVLNKIDILLYDRDEYIDKVDKIVSFVLGIRYADLTLHRIDYCVDLELDRKIMLAYVYHLYIHSSKYSYMIRKGGNGTTSIYLSSKYGKTRVNIYDKYTCEKQKGNPDYKKYYNIFRIEVQCMKGLIKHVSKDTEDKLKKFKDQETQVIIENAFPKLDKKLEGYWNKEGMEKYFFRFLEGFLYTGDYCKTSIAKKIINKSSHDKKWKKKLKDFVKVVNEFGVTGAIRVTKTKSKSKNELEDMAIYELGDEIETKQKIKHQTWSKATVDGYIEMLSELGINPVTLDDVANYDTLENLVTLARRTAEEKYFKEAVGEAEVKTDAEYTLKEIEEATIISPPHATQNRFSTNYRPIKASYVIVFIFLNQRELYKLIGVFRN